ncbi:MAG: arylsulfatase, partial [Opitutae bacterium]|nr:arylsulfatase [Opitutae bacterium]
LFDLSKDPGQTQNIASDNPELLKKLKAKLLQINQSVMADGTDWHLQ